MTQTFEFPAPVLSVAADAVRQLESGDALPRLWAVFAKCKSSIQDGRRLENISWRLWYREMAAASSHGRRQSNGMDISGHLLNDCDPLSTSSGVNALEVSTSSVPHMTSQHQVNPPALDQDPTLAFNPATPDATVPLSNQQNALPHLDAPLIPSSPNTNPHPTMSTRRNSFVGKIIVDMLPNCIPALPPSPAPSQLQSHIPPPTSPRTPTSPSEHQFTVIATTKAPITSYFSSAIGSSPSSPSILTHQIPINPVTTASTILPPETVTNTPSRPPLRCHLPTPDSSEELIILPLEKISNVEPPIQAPLAAAVAQEKREPIAESLAQDHPQSVAVEVRVSEPSTPPKSLSLLPVTIVANATSASSSADVIPPLLPPRLVVVHPTPGPTPHPTPPATPTLGAGAGLSVNPPVQVQVPLSPAFPHPHPSPALASASPASPASASSSASGSHDTTTSNMGVPRPQSQRQASLGGEGSIVSSSYTTSSMDSSASDDMSTAVSSSGAGGNIDEQGKVKVESPKPMVMPPLSLLPPPMMQQQQQQQPPLSVAATATNTPPTQTTSPPRPPPARRSSSSTSTTGVSTTGAGTKSSSATTSTKPRPSRAHGHVRKTSSASAGGGAGKGGGGGGKLSSKNRSRSGDVGVGGAGAAAPSALLMTSSTGASGGGGGGKRNVGVGVGKGRTLIRRTGSGRGAATLGTLSSAGGGRQGNKSGDKDKDKKLAAVAAASFDVAGSNSDDGSAVASKSTGSVGSSEVSRVVLVPKDTVLGKEKAKVMAALATKQECDGDPKCALVVPTQLTAVQRDSSSSQPTQKAPPVSNNTLPPPPPVLPAYQDVGAHNRTLPDLAKLVPPTEQNLQQLLELQRLHQLQSQQRRTMVLATSESDDDDYETETDSDAEGVERGAGGGGEGEESRARKAASAVEDDREEEEGEWSSEDMSTDEVDVVLRRDDGHQPQPPQPQPQRQETVPAQRSAVVLPAAVNHRPQHLQQPQPPMAQRPAQQPPTVNQGQGQAPPNLQRVQQAHPQQRQHQQQLPHIAMTRVQQSRRDQAARAQYVVEQAALEAERIRDMFTKKPMPSSEQLKEEKRTRSTGLLSQLMNPDPNIFPPNHPYRRGQSSGAIRQPRAGVAGMTAVVTAGAGAGKAKAEAGSGNDQGKVVEPAAEASAVTAVPAGQVKARALTPTVAPSVEGRKPQERKPSIGMAPSMRLTKSSAAGPVASQVQVGSVLHGRRASDVAAVAGGSGAGGSRTSGPGQVGPNNSTSGGGLSGGYRPKGRPADLEMEDDSDSDDEGNDGRDAILVSKSVAQEKLNAFAQRRGIVPHSNSTGQKDSAKTSGEEEAEPVPDWIRQPEVNGTSQVPAGAGEPPQLQQPQEERAPTPAPIPFGHPYNLPPAAPPSTPRTTRRLMLQHEMSESLRRNLLWERRISKISLVGFRRSSSSGGRGGNVLGADVRPLAGLPSLVQLTAKKPEGSGNENENGGATRPEERERRVNGDLVPVPPETRQMEEQRRRALARNRSWDYHYSGW